MLLEENAMKLRFRFSFRTSLRKLIFDLTIQISKLRDLF
ncbi:hypothetical protein AEYBE204_04625 [Asticcacaulis sp. YBE204]|nr:hypothetical protein AEYBE204_04625 [Asticcacaulis sp. YBE204]